MHPRAVTSGQNPLASHFMLPGRGHRLAGPAAHGLRRRYALDGAMMAASAMPSPAKRAGYA